MSELILLMEIVLVFGGLLIIKKECGKAGLIGWIGIATILANLLTAKNVVIFGIETATGSVWFASTFLATDMLTEYYSKEDAKRGLVFGIISSLFFIIAPQITLLYAPSAIDFVNEHMQVLFGLNLRISVASLIMYVVANYADIWLFAKIKEKMQGKHLWVRNNVATILTNCLENFGFATLAFVGVYDWGAILSIALGTSLIEIIIAICDTPFLYLAKKFKHGDETA